MNILLLILICTSLYAMELLRDVFIKNFFPQTHDSPASKFRTFIFINNSFGRRQDETKRTQQSIFGGWRTCHDLTLKLNAFRRAMHSVSVHFVSENFFWPTTTSNWTHNISTLRSTCSIPPIAIRFRFNFSLSFDAMARSCVQIFVVQLLSKE